MYSYSTFTPAIYIAIVMLIYCSNAQNADVICSTVSIKYKPPPQIMCLSIMLNYFYNVQTKQCEEIGIACWQTTYKNAFGTLSECNATCYSK